MRALALDYNRHFDLDWLLDHPLCVMMLRQRRRQPVDTANGPNRQADNAENSNGLFTHS
jgi:hypothetical protein